jgi:hypothetical protein
MHEQGGPEHAGEAFCLRICLRRAQRCAGFVPKGDPSSTVIPIQVRPCGKQVGGLVRLLWTPPARIEDTTRPRSFDMFSR